MNISRRRNTSAVVGYVNFPTATIPSTGEGGQFVRLVVLDSATNFDNRFVPCCGGEQSFVMDETFVGDDLFGSPEQPEGVEYGSWYFKEYLPKFQEMEAKYFPSLHLEPGDRPEDADDNFWIQKYTSRPFLAIVTLGATGWSNGEWVCTVNDLTPEGKLLYETMCQLYPGCEIRLLTFLDT